MDSAADSLLALSNTAVALAEEEDVEEEDDRSSSLSELEDDAPDTVDSEVAGPVSGVDADSEAETERLEESPDKATPKKAPGTTPSKLAQTAHVDDRPEIESLTDSDSVHESDLLSPLSSDDELDGSSEAPADDAQVEENQYENRSPAKRKREEEQDEEGQTRARRRRTGSSSSEDAASEPGSEAEDVRSQVSRSAVAHPDPAIEAPEGDLEDEEEQEQEDGDQKDDSNEDTKTKQASVRSRATRSRGKEDLEVADDQEAEDEPEPVEESDEAEADDAEASAKSAEEQAKRMAAMDALTALERHFATLRDRLYDERIAAINHELAQLDEKVPSHPELLRQLEAVRKYRDDKFEVEQKLLVHKVGALKNKSVADRSQIHSAYYQTVRDVREAHLERLSEHFYRIQRDRFKSETAMPSYTIPFPDRRSKRITQQTAYNKEVSILSGVARYVGFPAAPELAQSHQKELEEDMQKMGLSMTQIRAGRVPRLTSAFSSAMTAQAAEEQFLEKNAWANAQHPMHKLMASQHRQHTPSNETFLTPAHQPRIADLAGGGSASTIVEHPSAPVSSNLNTPHDLMNEQTNVEAPNGILGHTTQTSSPAEGRRQDTSVMETDQKGHSQQTQDTIQDGNSSPLAGRDERAGTPSRPAALLAEALSTHAASSPPHPIRAPGIMAGSGFGGGRFGFA